MLHLLTLDDVVELRVTSFWSHQDLVRTLIQGEFGLCRFSRYILDAVVA